jgi:hypothetical protein
MTTPEQELQASRFRYSVGFEGTDVTSLPTEDVLDFLAQAGEVYEDPNTIDSYGRVLFFEGLFASAAKMATYKKNQTTENISDIFLHVETLLNYWMKKTATANELALGLVGNVRVGKTTRVPTKWHGYPNS